MFRARTSDKEIDFQLVAQHTRKIMNGVKSFVIISIAWQLLSMIIGNSYILPGIDKLILEYPKLFTDPRFTSAIKDSVFFLLQTWILILIILFFVVVLSVLNKQFRYIFKSLCSALQPTPTFTWLPVFMLVFGVNELTMTLLMIFSTLWMVGLNLMAVLEQSLKQWHKHCVNLKLNIIESVTKVYLPSLRPIFLANIKTCWNLSWRILIAVEVVFGTIGQHWGIGTYMTDAKDIMETSMMYAVFMIIMIIGIMTNELFNLMEREKCLK